jgi:WD40 repeat protein
VALSAPASRAGHDRGHRARWIKSAVVAADGFIATSHADQTIRVWDKADGKPLRQFEPAPLGAILDNLRYSASGGWVVDHSDDQNRIWKYKSGDQIQKYHLQFGIKSPDWAPENRISPC